MPPFRSITQACHDWLRPFLRPGCHALDATAGNGNDTLWLARMTAPDGRVWALDCQPEALEATRQRLALAGFEKHCRLILGDHRTIANDLPAEAHHHLDAVVFNLGYLPGGDRTIVTRTESTLQALGFAWQALKPGGGLAAVCYPGHPEGADESAAVRTWFQAIRTSGRLHEVCAGATSRPAPFLLALQKPVQ